MVLRLVLGSQADLERTELLCDHAEKLSSLERQVYKENVVKFIRGKLGMKQFSEEQIFRFEPQGSDQKFVDDK